MFVIVAAFILRYLIGTLNPGLGVQRPEIEALAGHSLARCGDPCRSGTIIIIFFSFLFYNCDQQRRLLKLFLPGTASLSAHGWLAAAAAHD